MPLKLWPSSNTVYLLLLNPLYFDSYLLYSYNDIIHCIFPIMSSILKRPCWWWGGHATISRSLHTSRHLVERVLWQSCMTNRGFGHQVQHTAMMYPAPLNPHHFQLTVSSPSQCIHVVGLDITYTLVWYQMGQGSPLGGKGKPRTKTTRKVTGNHLTLFSLD